MNRAEFLKTLGFGSLAIATISTITTCGKDGKASNGLTVYKTELSDNLLRIYS
jgi:hypothetical protein